MAAIAGIALALYGAYQSKRSGDKSARAEKEALAAANEQLKYRQIYKTGQNFFPGLLEAPKKPGAKPDPWNYLSGQASSGANLMGSAPGSVTSNLAPTHGGVDTTQVPQMGTPPPTATQTSTPVPSVGQDSPAPVTQPTNQGKSNVPATTGQPTTAPNTASGPNVGAMVTESLQNLLMHPGQLGTQTYERDQEQANQGLNVVRGLGNITGVGVDPRSGIGQTTTESGVLNFAKQRSEAARDYSIAQEELRRQDITQAVQMYTDFLSTIFGLQKAKAGVAGAVPQHAGAGNAMLGQGATNLGGGIATAAMK